MVKHKYLLVLSVFSCLNVNAADVEFMKIKETGIELETAIQICKTVAVVKFNDSIAEYQLHNPIKAGEFHIAWQDKAKRYATLKRNSTFSTCLLDKGYVVKQ